MQKRKENAQQDQIRSNKGPVLTQGERGHSNENVLQVDFQRSNLQLKEKKGFFFEI